MLAIQASWVWTMPKLCWTRGTPSTSVASPGSHRCHGLQLLVQDAQGQGLLALADRRLREAVSIMLDAYGR